MKSAIRVFVLTRLFRNPARRLVQLAYILCSILNLKQPVIAQPQLVSTPVNYNDISITTIRPLTTPQVENGAMVATYSITHKTVTNDRTGGTVCGTGYWKTCVW